MLEVFGEHTLECGRDPGAPGISVRSARGLWLSYIADTTSFLAPRPVSYSHVPRGGERQLRDASRDRWYSLSFSPCFSRWGSAYTPTRAGLLMMPQAIAAMSLKLTMPGILARFGYRTVLISNTLMIGLLIWLFADDRAEHAIAADHCRAVRVRILHVVAIHEYEHAGLLGHRREGREQRQHHRQHQPADGRSPSASRQPRW